MQIKILGYPWTLKVLKKKDFKKKFKKCKAVTLPQKQEIYFREDVVNTLYMRHELAHAFIFYCCKEEITLNDHDWEEFSADFLAIHGETIIKLSDKILRELK